MTRKAIFLSACLILPALADGPPRGAYSGDDFEAAKAKALETGKPIAVVVTDTATSCPKCQYGNEEVFKRMRSDYVLVVKDDATEGTLPDAVQNKAYEIYKSKGNVMPIVAVLSQDDQRVLGGLCYKQISADSRKAFKALDEEVETNAAKAPEKKTAKKDEGEAPAATTASDSEANESGTWTNYEGQTIRAEVVEVGVRDVTFRMESGKLVEYPLANLSEESRQKILELDR